MGCAYCRNTLYPCFHFRHALDYLQIVYGRQPDTPIREAIAEQPLVLFVGLCGFTLGMILLVYAKTIVDNRSWFNPAWVLRNRRGEFVLLLCSTIVSVLCLEFASRFLYANQYQFPLLHDREALLYPPLYEQFHNQPPNEPSVLLLGGSVLWGAGRKHIIEDATDPPINAYNLAQTGQSTRDSLNKLEYVTKLGYRFDYIIFYHGINEVRANNVPPDVFQSDYDHYSFNHFGNTIFQSKRPFLNQLLRSSLCFRAYSLWVTLRSTSFFGQRYLHIAFPREDWLQYGDSIKSAKSFEGNLLNIATIAQEQGSTLIVPYFVYDPQLDTYQSNPETFVNMDMRHYTQQWGLPGHVWKGLQEHNSVMALHADRYHYSDATKVFMQSPDNFTDPCHFTDEAAPEFAHLLKDVLGEEIIRHDQDTQ